jgi:geranylgeranyl diphosphate synthase, type III
MGFSPTRAVLKPVPESIWIAPSPGKRLHSASFSSSPPGLNPLLLNDDLSQGPKKTWSQEKEKILLGPFDYMFGHPGKDIRKQLIAGFNAWLKVPEESLVIITKVIGMLHTASLL